MIIPNHKLFCITVQLLIIIFGLQNLLLAEEPKIEESYWNLPSELNTSNTEISFKVDSTWHLVHYLVKEINGRAWLDDPKDYQSVRAEVRLPVKSFDSENGFRDKKMRSVTAAERFPEVIYQLNQLEDLCPPIQIMGGKECQINVRGKLKIRDIEQDFSFPAKVIYQLDRFVIKGNAELDWSTYGVEDPSILVAKVDKKVVISILLKL